MKYFPDNLVTVNYVLATLQNYKGESAEVQAELRTEAIQKLGQLAQSYANEMVIIADRYQLLIDRQKLTSTATAITGAVASAIPIPIVQGLGVLVGLAGSLISGVQGKNVAKAQAELQALQLKIQQTQAAIQQLQADSGNSYTLYFVLALIVALYFIIR
ncbi:hypothetical protein [Runella limosa]|uniref:hypothetical protein n=1 Tax=Runella limosa TaxID=370978 RepID=UPI0003FBE54B|nr:hypothetical protein [Runella limosa]